MDRAAILVFELSESWHQIIAAPLRHHGLKVIQTSQITSVLQFVQEERAGAVLLGPSTVDSGNALELARQIRQSARTIPLLLIASKSSEELAIAALRAGINDYVKHPFCSEELTAAVQHCLSLRYPQTSATTGPAANLTEGERMVGESAAMRRVKAYLAKVAATDTSVLITGETGTGKELAAELVHRNSHRRQEPIVTINCAAVPDSLFESELFGYERGAFTGAQHANEGKLKTGDGGTVFLDEIGDMSSYAQAKMLRVIDSKEIDRLGGRQAVPLDVRFIAATNQDLEQLVKEGKFRKDLFFRLNVARIRLPPLRDRREDIRPLFDYYIQALNARFGMKVRQLTEEALEHLLAHDWPGNVRELKNVLEAVFVEVPSAEISLDALPLAFRARGDKLKVISSDERERLLCALLSTNWNKSKAAEKLHWSRMTLYRKLAQFHIVRMDRTQRFNA